MLKKVGKVCLAILFVASLFISGTAIWGAVDGNVSFVDKLTVQQEQQVETPNDETNTETGDEIENGTIEVDDKVENIEPVEPNT